MFLESLRHDLARNLESDLLEIQPNLSSVLKRLSSQESIETVLELPIELRLALTDAITQSIRQELLSKVA